MEGYGNERVDTLVQLQRENPSIEEDELYGMVEYPALGLFPRADMDGEGFCF